MSYRRCMLGYSGIRVECWDIGIRLIPESWAEAEDRFEASAIPAPAEAYEPGILIPVPAERTRDYWEGLQREEKLTLPGWICKSIREVAEAIGLRSIYCRGSTEVLDLRSLYSMNEILQYGWGLVIEDD